MDIDPRPLFGSASTLLAYAHPGAQHNSCSPRGYLGQFPPELKATEAFELAVEHLDNYREAASFDRLRTSVERLILWALLVRRKTIFELNRSDVFDFFWFVQDPPSTWLAEKSTPRYVRAPIGGLIHGLIPNPKWRPYTIDWLPAETQTLYAILSACSLFYTHLVKLSVVIRNPFEELLSRTPTQSSTASTSTTFLSSADWDLVVYAVRRLATINPKMHERTLFVVAAISQLNVTHSEFFDSVGAVITLDCFIHVDGNWILRLDSGDVPVPNTFMDKDLKRFCDFRGLSLADGNSPLIPRVRGIGKATRRSIIKLITSAFREASRYAADPESFQAAGKAWISAEASLPKLDQRMPSFASSNIHRASPPKPQPLYSDFKNVRGKVGDVADHADTLLFLDSCPAEASPSDSYTLGKRFLYKLKNKHTYEAYRKFVERLLLWSILVKMKSIQSLTQIDLHEFSEFSKAPPNSWIRTTLEHRFIKVCAGSRIRTAAVTTANPAWRPYRVPIHADARPGPVSYHASNETSAGQFAVVRGFYNYLLSEGAVNSNPLINRAAFLSYGLRKKSKPRKRQGITGEVFQHVIEGCFENLSGFHLIRMIFIIYTINELQLSWVKVRDYGSAFTLDNFRRDFEDWLCAFVYMEGTEMKVVSVNGNYIEQVLEPYAEFVISRGFSRIDRQWLFSSLTGRKSISVYLITRALNEVCRAKALKMQQEGRPISLVERVRHVTINDLGNAPKPAAYMKY